MCVCSCVSQFEFGRAERLTDGRALRQQPTINEDKSKETKVKVVSSLWFI